MPLTTRGEENKMKVVPAFPVSFRERLLAEWAVYRYEPGWHSQALAEYESLSPQGMHVREGFFAARKTSLLERHVLRRRINRLYQEVSNLETQPLQARNIMAYDSLRFWLLRQLPPLLRHVARTESALGNYGDGFTEKAAELEAELRDAYPHFAL